MNLWQASFDIENTDKNRNLKLTEGRKTWLKAERGWGWGGGQSQGDKQDAGR